jgi:hypothetical protein
MSHVRECGPGPHLIEIWKNSHLKAQSIAKIHIPKPKIEHNANIMHYTSYIRRIQMYGSHT